MSAVLNRLTSHPPTPEQQLIIDAIRPSSGSHSVMVEAGAGCAKTTTLEMSAANVRVPALALAFNKRIQTELGARLPGNFTCKTMNALGHAAFARATGLNLKIDDRKIGRIITEISKARRMNLTSDQWDGARMLVREAQIQGLVPNGCGPESLVDDTPEGWRELLSSASSDLDIDDFDYIWETARESLIESLRLARLGIITFDDQIYCSTLISGQFGRFPFIFLDEDQDLNPLQIRMVVKSMRQDSRILAVGDVHQSIYAFRGAVGQAAEQLKLFTTRPSWTDLPLMTSFRVPQLVADRQRAHVPLFRAHGANPSGAIFQLGSSHHRLPWEPDPIEYETPDQQHHGWTWEDVLDALPDPHTDLAVLCRNNAPLLSLAFALIRRGIGVKMAGRDLGKGLVALVKKIARDESTPADTVRGRLDAWLLSERTKAEANGRPDLADRAEDKAECIIAVLDGTLARDAGQLCRQIERLFAREQGLVTLSSIHRAKGLEWPAVLLLDPWRMPHKRALASGGRALEQEHNLRYVAETRTKHTLMFANLEHFQ